MSLRKFEKNKQNLIKQIFNTKTNNNKEIKSQKEYDNIIIPEPKKKIKRSIFGDKTNNESFSSNSNSYKNDSDNDIYINNYTSDETYSDNNNDEESNDNNKYKKLKLNYNELKCISEISNLCINCDDKSKINNLINITKKEYKPTSENINYNEIIQREIKKLACKNEKKKLISKENNKSNNIYINKNRKKEYEITKNDNFYENQLVKMDISEENEFNDVIDGFLPCRKEEQLKIYNYIKNGLKTNGNYNSLYIGGMPGTGKTECIKKVIEYIENENKANNDIPFRTLFINCVNFPKTSKLFKSIYNFIFSKNKKPKVKTSQIILILDNFFCERNSYNGDLYLNDPSNSHIILILDEIDYLINRSQFLLYHIFNWTTYSNSKLIIVSISNLLNITNHLLPKIVSRFGQNKVMFKPYTKEQIRIIIKYKGIDLQKFDEDALKLSSMKVAAINGDLRRVISILKKAREIFENEIIEKKLKYNEKCLINKLYILEACKELFDCKIVNVLKNFKIAEKIVISSILLKIKNDNSNSIKLEELYNNLNVFLSKYNEYNLNNGNIYLDITWDEFQKIVYNLLRIKIIELNDNTFINFKDNYIHIRFYVDEFMTACEYDEDFKPIFNFLENLLN